MASTKPSLKRKLARAALGVTGAVLVLGLVIHLPPIRGWLHAHGHDGTGVCPLGYGPKTAEVNAAANAKLRGDQPAHARPALGFELDKTTADDVMAWADDHHVTCTTQHGGTMIECDKLPAGLLPGGLSVSSAWLVFGGNGTLASIATTRHASDADSVSAAFTAVESEVTSEAGAPVTSHGSASPGALSAGLLRQASVEYRFTDYHAVVRATNMGPGRDFLLTEEYKTLVD